MTVSGPRYRRPRFPVLADPARRRIARHACRQPGGSTSSDPGFRAPPLDSADFFARAGELGRMHLESGELRRDRGVSEPNRPSTDFFSLRDVRTL